MTQDWSNDMNWIVPPPKMVSAVLQKMDKERAMGILIVPAWKSAPYWPMVISNERIIDTYLFQKEDYVCPGISNEGVFCNKRVNFQMMACLFR